MPERDSYGSFADVPLGLPNSLVECRPDRPDPRAIEEMEVEIVNTMLGRTYTPRTDPAFVVRSH